MTVSPRDIFGTMYLARKKKGWMLVLNVSSHSSLITLDVLRNQCG